MPYTDGRLVKLHNRRIRTARDGEDVVVQLRMLHSQPFPARDAAAMFCVDDRTGRISQLTFRMTRESAGTLAAMILSEYPDVAATCGVTMRETKGEA